MVKGDIGAERIETLGDFSPGIVMGNFIVNQGLVPAPMALKEAFKIYLQLRPSKNGHFVEIYDGRKVFINGCKFELNIGNAGTADLVLRVLQLSVQVEEIPRQMLPETKKPYGAIFTPHQLFVELHRDKAPGWWLLSEGMRHSDPRPFVDGIQDLLASPEKSRLLFRLSPGEMEEIEGAFIPRDDGLFRVRFTFGISTPNEKYSCETDEFLISRGTADHGD
jgi:hypothetical protein